MGALSGLGVEEARGDVTDPASLPSAVPGRDVVFHLAGIRRAPRREEEPFCPREWMTPIRRR